MNPPVPAAPALPSDALPTLALHAGLQIDAATGAIAPSLCASVNHLVKPGEAAFSAEGVEDLAQLPYMYARWTNPTVRQLEQRLAALEGGEDALATATGVAAMPEPSVVRRFIGLPSSRESR